jgi:hypothetical protein
MLWLGSEQTPTRVVMNIYIELFAASVLLDIGSVDSDDISNLAHNGAVFKSLGIDHNDGMLKVLLLFQIFIVRGVQGNINDLERANPLVLGIAGVAGVHNHSIHVDLVTLIPFKV